MRITPDSLVFWQWGWFTINGTVLYTWVVMAILVVGARLITLNLSTGDRMSRWQNLLEVIVDAMSRQITDVTHRAPGRYMPFIGTLFLFIATADLLAIVPGYVPPTASLSTTTALALSVLVAVPVYGIASKGIGRYLRDYLRPSPLMLPFNVIGEFSRTLALAIRLYGNIMSGTVIAGILIGIAPIFFPVLFDLLGMLTGLIQAYIFAVLAMVYIASAAGSDTDVQSAEKEG